MANVTKQTPPDARWVNGTSLYGPLGRPMADLVRILGVCSGSGPGGRGGLPQSQQAMGHVLVQRGAKAHAIDPVAQALSSLKSRLSHRAVLDQAKHWLSPGKE